MRGSVRGSLSGRKEEGSLTALSQVHLRLGGYWRVVPCACLPMSICQSFQVAVELDLARFWEVEEIPRVKPMSKENRQCVEHYDTTTYVDGDGRITVHHSGVKQQSCGFIKNLVDMEDLEDLEEASQTSGLGYYLPHLCEFNDSTTTTLRVVFDTSSDFPNFYSLNDSLLLGHRVQDDVFDILIRSRFYPLALSTDVANMHRQVAFGESDCTFQLIL